MLFPIETYQQKAYCYSGKRENLLNIRRVDGTPADAGGRLADQCITTVLKSLKNKCIHIIELQD